MANTVAGARRLPVKTCLRLSMIITLAVFGFATAVLHYLQQDRLREEARHAVANATAKTLTLQLHTKSFRGEDPQEICTRLLDNPAVLAVALWDASGRSFGSAAVNDELPTLLDHPRTDDCSTPQTERVEIAAAAHRASGVYRVETAISPQPGEPLGNRAGFLLVVPGALPGQGGGRWMFLLPLTICGIASYCLGTWYLGRRIDGPMQRLVAAAAKEHGASGRPTGSEVHDEFQVIANSLGDLQADLEHWRGQAEHLERRLDRQIAAETQRITRDLRRLQRDVYRDALTGIYNRRMLNEKLPGIFDAQRAAQQDLSVIMLDVDHLKELNDTSGHQAGDKVLAFLGELLRETSRADDLAVRYGGDEFVLILPGISAPSASAMAKRLVAMFDQRVRAMADVRPAPTLSAGVASLWNDVPGSQANLLELADQALYEAKRRGRSLVHVNGV